jgi:fructokinase
VPAVLSVIGEALIDFVDAGDHSTFAAYPSGSPLNVAVGLARLGHDTEFMARFGEDTFGRMLRAHAERNGVGLSSSVAATEQSSLAIATLDQDAKAHYDFYLTGTADWQWTDAELRVPPATRILHAGSLTSWLPPGADRVIEMLRRVRDDMLVSYDPNVRPGLLGTPEQARELIERAVAVAHLVKASDDDIGWLYPGDSEDAIAARWLALGATTVVITRGERGARAYRPGAAPLERPAREIRLVDTIGAGDAFTSGLLGALARAGVRDAPGLAAADLVEALDEAILVAALTCERAGADPPTAAELEAASTRSAPDR